MNKPLSTETFLFTSLFIYTVHAKYYKYHVVSATNREFKYEYYFISNGSSALQYLDFTDNNR